MKLRPITKLDKQNMATTKKMMMTSCRQIGMSLSFFPFGAIRKPDSGRMICKIYIFINSNFLSYKN